MTSGSSVKSIAACFGFAAFSVAIMSGLAADRTLPEILGGAIASLLACFAIGVVIGIIAERAIDESASSYRVGRPGRDPAGTKDKTTDPHAEGTPA